MALSARCLGRQLLGANGFRSVFLSQCRSVTIQPRPAEPALQEGHDERNMRLCRPQSPYLLTYKWPLPAILSITHRGTGIALSGYATTFAVVSLLSSKPMGEIIQNISQCYPTFFLLFKLGMIFPFSYHFFNGIRHLIWDTGKALTLKGCYVSGYIMLLCAFTSFGALMYYSEELKRIAREEEEKRKAEEEAKAAADAAAASKKKKRTYKVC